MRPVRYNVAASLDGFIATVDGGYDWIPEDPTVDFGALFAKVDTVVLGRRSYEVALQAPERPWGPETRVYVVSSTLDAAAHPDVTIIRAAPEQTVDALRHEAGDGEIWLFGGGLLFRSLLAAGVVDRVEVTVVPVLLGEGVPLLAGGAGRVPLQLIETHRYASGLLTLTYEPTQRRTSRAAP